MSKPIKIKVKVNLVDKALMFHGKNGAVYLDLVAWPNKGGEDQYGNTHYIKQEKPRDSQQEMPIIGNLTVPGHESSPGGEKRDGEAPTRGAANASNYRKPANQAANTDMRSENSPF